MFIFQILFYGIIALINVLSSPVTNPGNNALKEMKSTYIYPLEDLKKNVQKGWSTSNYTDNYKYGFTVQFDPNAGNSVSQTLDNVGKGGFESFALQEETFGVQINSLKIFYDNNEMIYGKDAVIVSDISKTVTPNNYFDPSDYTKTLTKETISKLTTECLYKNPGPTYSRAILKSVGVDSVVNMINRNLGIKYGQPGIKVLTMNEFILNYDNFDDYLKVYDNDGIYANTNNITFSKLFISQDNHNNQQYYSNKFLLTALTKDQDMYFFNITDDSHDKIDFLKFNVLPKSLFSFNNIMKVELCGEKIVIATKENGVCVIYPIGTDTSKWKILNFDKFNNNPFILTDMKIINSTAFIIAEKMGMISFDLQTLKYNNDYFSHPNLSQVDHTTYNGMSYIGVVVQNFPPSIPEFYIEFAFNYTDQSHPLINKVFTSNSKIPLTQIVSDDQLGVTYLFDTHMNTLLILNRAIPNSLFAYNFKTNFMNYYDFKKELGLQLFLLSSNDVYYPHLIIKNGDDYILFGRFSFPKNILRCRFNQEGNFRFEFSAPGDCSTQDNGKFDYKVCWNNATFDVIVDNRPLMAENEENQKVDGLKDSDKIAVGVIVGVLGVAALIIIIIVLCCRKRNCCGKNSSIKTLGSDVEYVQQNNKDGEMMEVNVVDNKL